MVDLLAMGILQIPIIKAFCQTLHPQLAPTNRLRKRDYSLYLCSAALQIECVVVLGEHLISRKRLYLAILLIPALESEEQHDKQHYRNDIYGNSNPPQPEVEVECNGEQNNCQLIVVTPIHITKIVLFLLRSSVSEQFCTIFSSVAAIKLCAK